LFNFKHEAWLPRRRALQPVFTKKHVTRFAGQCPKAATSFRKRGAMVRNSTSTRSAAN
jgi:cytochrome P450